MPRIRYPVRPHTFVSPSADSRRAVVSYWSSVQSGDSGTTFWSTTPTFETPPLRAVGILGQPFRAPPQLLEHQPIEPWGFWDNFLEHKPNTTPSAQQREHQPARVGVLVQLFGTPEPPTRPRATPYMVRVLVQPLQHHPTEPQGQDHESGQFR